MRVLMLTLIAAVASADYVQAQPTAADSSTSQAAVRSPATSEPTSEPVDPLEASRKIEEQIAKLQDTPIGKELTSLHEKMRAVQDEADKTIRPLDEQYRTLCESKEGRSYWDKYSDLTSQRDEEWAREQKVIADAAKRIYSARHDELRKTTSRPAPNLGKLGFDVLNYPRVDGSTSTHPLSVILACKAFSVPYEWVYAKPSGYPFYNKAPLPRYLFLEYVDGPNRNTSDMEFNLAACQVVAKPGVPEQERVAIIINSLLAVSTNTHVAYEDLVNRKCDLNLTARAPSEDELKLAKEKGVKIELKPIARDALVFIVNHKNTVKSLTQKQLVEIYDGKIGTWTELGWTPREKEPQEKSSEIRPLRRERNSGSRELFDALVMKGRQLPEDRPWQKALFSNSMSGPFNRVTVEQQAMGYTVYYYEHFMAAAAFTRPIAIDGVEPTPETIASGKYPFVAEVYAAYRAGEPADSPAMKMLTWLLSDEGQTVIKESGYVPMK